ncbi:hypothetical protein OH491_03190 [Termitidicoccus mucosus]|uniref:General secretion pathway protein GspM n=1 Tax=Termitidicoccus mucosus TaxID=1184151 RepID=A0A178IM06_9BACT|nr:hypothetical protein AW736_06385 [Opitutaceae bacterium TSB47]
MKAFFLSRLFREKILLVGLVLIAAAMWLSSAGGRAATLGKQFRATSSTLAMQRVTIEAKDMIKARAEAAIEQLDPSRTFDRVRLQSELDTIANRAGIQNKSIGDAHTERVEQVAVNSAQVTIRNVDYASLVKFYEELKTRSPYISIEQFNISANTANPAQLLVSIRVSSVEIAR